MMENNGNIDNRMSINISGEQKSKIALVLIVGFLLFSVFLSMLVFMRGDSGILSYMVPLIFAGGSVVTANSYLRAPAVNFATGIDNKNKIDELRQQVDDLQFLINSSDRYVGDQEEIRSDLLKKYSEQVDSLGRQEIIDSVRNDFSNSYEDSRLEQYFYDAKQRMENVATKQFSTNLFNLVIGFTLTLIAFGFLGFAVLGSRNEFFAVLEIFIQNDIDVKAKSSAINGVFTIVPKLTLAIAIQVFAYFFLRLYKQGLEEVKYLHNEVTSIQMRMVAVSMAGRNNDKSAELYSKIAESLIKTERNYLISKDQTTIELEREKLSNSGQSDFLIFLKDAFKFKTDK